jgi:hypothetical protein
MTLSRFLYIFRVAGWIGKVPYRALQLLLALVDAARRRR